METTTLAIYIDFENLPKGIDIDLLMEAAASDTSTHVYAVKAAYGSAAALSKPYRQQLLDHNFQIVDTPHVAKKKNRADLFISIDAFERFHLGQPPIDRYIFVTSDSDFSVIMDKLRAYGKQVWLICRKADQAKKILSNCCDQMLSIEDFIPPTCPLAPTVDAEKSRLVERLAKQALRQIGPDGLPVGLSTLGMQMRKFCQDFDFKGTGFKRLTDLTVHLANAGIVKLGTNAKGMAQIEHVDESKLEIEDGDPVPMTADLMG